MAFRFAKIARFWPIGLLFLLEVLLFAANYTPGTWLMGWDNLLPELNFPANLTRSLFGVWQEHRGLGLYDGMSHTALLLHTIFLWLLSLAIPTSLLRYTFTFLMHFLGGLGGYFLFRYLISSSPVALVGALFYLFNPATIQMFYAPLEAFSVHFAALPWLALTLINYFETKNGKKLALFLLVALLSTPQFFVPTLILPVALLLAAISFFYLRRNWRYLAPVVVAALGFFLINAFWLLPYLAGLPHNAPVIAKAKINQMGSGEILLRNQAFGDLKNVLLLRGFSLDFDDLTSGERFDYMMQPWRRHLFAPLGEIAIWVLAGIAILGVGVSLRKNKRQFWPLLVTFVFGLVMLGSQIPGISFASQWLYRLPFFAEAFRLPFTKFSLLFAVSYSLFLALGLKTLSGLLAKFSRQALLIPAALVIGAIAFLSLPAASGNFLYANLRLKLPPEYLDLFNFIREQNPDGRIALLPQPSFWSWKFYRWGLRGSGFLWYGLAQPVLDRAFDPWGRENENYYWELSYALYSKNAKLIKDVLNKYDVSYVLLDENLIAASHNRALFIEETKELLTKIPQIKEIARFGQLLLYERANASNTFVSLKGELPTVSPIYQWTDNDVAYQELGDYITLPSTTTVYPYRSLFTKRSVSERGFDISEVAGKATSLVYDSSQTGDLAASKVSQCGLLKSGTAGAQEVDGALRLTSLNQRGCLSFNIANLSHRDGYLVAVESRHLAGRPLMFSLINLTAKHVELETYLTVRGHPERPASWRGVEGSPWQTDYFILPPLASDGLGYTVYLTNDSIGRQESINDIQYLRTLTT